MIDVIAIIPVAGLFVLIAAYWYLTFELIGNLLKKSLFRKRYRLLAGVCNALFMFTISALFSNSMIPYLFIVVILFAEVYIFYHDTLLKNMFCTAACAIHMFAIKAVATGIFSLCSEYSIHEIVNNTILYTHSILLTFVLLNIAVVLSIKYLPLNQVRILSEHREQQQFLLAWMIINIAYLLFNSSVAENPIFHIGMVQNQIIAPCVILICTYIMLIFAIKTVRLIYKAERDSLTGLYNRGLTDKLITEYLISNHTQSAAMFMIDVDNFKDINDHLGHLYGDFVLCELGEKLSHIFKNDDIVGRIGGDEFVAFIKEGATNKIIHEKGAQICKAFHKVCNDAQGQKYILSGSVGVAVSPKDGMTFEELYNHADTALYSAKNIGKSNFQIYDGSTFSGYQSQR